MISFFVLPRLFSLSFEAPLLLWAMLSRIFSSSSRFFAFIFRVIHETRMDVKLNKLADQIAVLGSTYEAPWGQARQSLLNNGAKANFKNTKLKKTFRRMFFPTFYDILENRCTAWRHNPPRGHRMKDDPPPPVFNYHRLPCFAFAIFLIINSQKSEKMRDGELAKTSRWFIKKWKVKCVGSQ